MQRPTVATPEYSLVSSARAEGVEPSYHCLKAAGLPLADTRVSIVKRVPCRSRTDLTGLEVQDLCRSANGTLKESSGGSNRTHIDLLNREAPYQVGYAGIFSQDGRI